MAIYRGTGGSAEATNNATVNEVASYATDAETSATNAASSATSAASSATSASSSATASASSATASESSATASATSASASATSASNASTSASQAASSASAASTSASNASTSETNAASSETAAASSASNAATSATNANTSASNASTSETNAATSASNASTSETNAATSASEAAASAASIVSDELESAANAAAAAQSYDNFDDRYLGAKASDPTVDNDGDALITGAMYFDSSNNVMKVYSGSEWQNASSSIEGIKSDFVFTATASQTVFSGNDDNTNELVIDKAGLTNVFLNGVRLADSDYTVNTGANSVTLASGAALNDVVEIEVFGNFAGQSGADVAITGGSITGLTELSTGTFTSTGIDDNATSTAITIDASENVGIGTSSPSALGKVLNVDGGSGGASIATDGGDNFAVMYTGQTVADPTAIFSNTGFKFATATAKDATGFTERARIDSAGNLLVGTTSLDGSTGCYIGNSGVIEAARSGVVQYLNRTGSDGQIAQFRKDGSTVGSIGVSGGDCYIATGTSGIRFVDSNNSIAAVDNTGSGRDALTDLGNSGTRFKDLYLSGGVFLGGTGAANKLDDYEEGVWTPAITTAGGTVTTDGTTCRYTKIGRVVHVAGEIGIDSVSSPTGSIQITLPFTARVGSNYQAAHATINTSATKAHADFTALVFSNHSYFRIYLNEYNTLSSSNPNAQQITTNSHIQFGFSYSAD